MSPDRERRRSGDAALEEEVARLKEVNEALLCSALDAQSRADHLDREIDELAHAAKLDALTRLPDRSHLLDRFEHAMAQARRNGTKVAILFVDLDGFKQINDRLGHTVGDQVLQWAAQAIVGAVREVDTVSRHGGDEFVIVLDVVNDADTATVVAQKIVAALTHSCQAGDHSVRVSASIGISLFPDHGEDASTLIERADAAMYQAKRGGAGAFCVHGDEPAHTSARAGTARDPVIEAHDPGEMHLQEANSELVLAALDAQELLSACKKAQERQTAFMGVLAHELRSPLTPIRIAVGMLGRGGDDDELQAQLKAVIDGQVTRMAELVGDLLEVSRMRTGKLHLSWQRMDLLDVVRKTVESARLSTQERGQHLGLETPEGELLIRGDPARLGQVFSNLLDNATRYTPKDGRIDVAVESGDDMARVIIDDSGIGITESALPFIFEPFVQDTHAVASTKSGLGIGLTVVHELVLAHGGSIEASSEGVGCGSRFVVTLPLDDTKGFTPPRRLDAGDAPA